MPKNIPEGPKTPKWQPEKDPNPISQADEEIANGITAAVIGGIIFLLIMLFPFPEDVMEHLSVFQYCSLAFMVQSSWILGRIRR